MQVATEEALIGDLRQSFPSLRDRTTFLDFDQLMNPTFPRAVGHDPPGIFVDDLNLAVGDDVLHIATIEMERTQCMLHKLLAPAANGPQSRQAGRLAGDLGFAVRGEVRGFLVGVQLEIVAKGQTPARSRAVSYRSAAFSPPSSAPERISGTRASSIRTLSAS